MPSKTSSRFGFWSPGSSTLVGTFVGKLGSKLRKVFVIQWENHCRVMHFLKWIHDFSPPLYYLKVKNFHAVIYGNNVALNCNRENFFLTSLADNFPGRLSSCCSPRGSLVHFAFFLYAHWVSKKQITTISPCESLTVTDKGSTCNLNIIIL